MKRFFRFILWSSLILGLFAVSIVAVLWYLWSSNLPYIGSLREYNPPIITEVFSDEGEVIGSSDDLLTLCDEYGIGEIVVALDDRRGIMPMEVLLRCRLQGLAVTEAANFVERVTGKIAVDWINPSWLIFSDGFQPFTRSRNALEWLFNAFLALVLLGVTSPIMLLTLVGILIEDGWKHGAAGMVIPSNGVCAKLTHAIDRLDSTCVHT